MTSRDRQAADPASANSRGWWHPRQAWPVVVGVAAAAALWVIEAAVHTVLEGDGFIRHLVNLDSHETRVVGLASIFFVGAGVTVQMIRQYSLSRLDAAQSDLAEMRRRLNALASGKTRDQWRSAYMLHEAVAQDLAACTAILRSAKEEPRREEMERKLARVTSLLEHSIEEINGIAVALSPGLMDELELPSALDVLSDRLRHESGIDARMALDPVWRLLPSDRQKALRDLLGTIISKAASMDTVTYVHAEVGRSADALVVNAAYDGFDPFEDPCPSGACEALGGHCTYETPADLGTAVEVIVPLRTGQGPASPTRV